MYQTSSSNAAIKYRDKLTDWIAGGKLNKSEFVTSMAATLVLILITRGAK